MKTLAVSYFHCPLHLLAERWRPIETNAEFAVPFLNLRFLTSEP